MAHTHRLAGVDGQEGRVERDRANIAAGNVQSRQLLDRQPFGWRRVREDLPPDYGALRGIGKPKQAS